MDNRRKTDRRRIKRRSKDGNSVEDLIKLHEFLAQNTRDIILTIRHRDRRILEANEAAVNTYQYTLNELQLMTVDDLRSPDSQSQITPQLNAAGSRGILFETVHMKKNGATFPVEVSSQGAMVGKERILLSIVRDISERKKAQQETQDSETNLRALLNAVTESFFLTDKDGTVMAANETFAKRLRISLDKIIGTSVYDLLPPDISAQRRQQAENVIMNGKPVRFEDVRNNRHIDQVIYPVFDADGHVVRLAVFGADITQRREIEKELQAIALTDQLTGLYNRRGFFTLARRELHRTQRSKNKMLLFFADLDGMKAINDSFGHEEGDRALIASTKILVQTFRSSDIISRIGGDEFAILAVDADEIILDSLLGRFNKLMNYLNARKNQKYKLSISIGHAIYDPWHPLSLDELISKADLAMYEKKKIHKKSVGIY